MGRAYLRALARHLRRSFDADLAYVGLLEEGGRRIRTAAVAARSGSPGTFAYGLEGTPCARALAQPAPVILRRPEGLADEVASLLPADAELYLGQRLVDAGGAPLGVLALVFAREAGRVREAAWALEVFAPRAAVEIERDRREEALRIGSTVFEASGEAIMVTDATGRIRAVNPAFTRITGYAPEEVVGRTPALLRSGRHDEAFYRAMRETLRREGRWEGEIWNRRKNGEIYAEWLSIAAIADPGDGVAGYVAVFTDITRRKRDEARVWRQANYDVLTGLPNRVLFMDRLARALTAARRAGHRLALLFVDLDRFKWVNDSLGHAAGDELLRETGMRLRACVRETDTVARLSGDEFLVLLAEIGRTADAERVARTLLARLEQPFRIRGHELKPGASVGIAIFPEDGEDVETLLRHADAAMYRAKEGGRGTFRFFTPEMDAEMARRAEVEQALRRALVRGELALLYQPVWRLRDRVPVGVEALLRWHHPERGVLRPAVFMEVAEDTGLAPMLLRWTLERMGADAVWWAGRGLGRVQAGFNLPARLLRDETSVEQVVAAAHACRPAWVLLAEITEEAGEEEMVRATGALAVLRRRGVGLVLDDFGTGRSSLTWLRRMPVAAVKIDGSLLREAAAATSAARLVEALVGLAHGLGLEVVAEGVEDEALLRLAVSLGFDLAQGHALAPPLPLAEAAERFQRAGRRSPPRSL